MNAQSTDMGQAIAAAGGEGNASTTNKTSALGGGSGAVGASQQQQGNGLGGNAPGVATAVTQAQQGAAAPNAGQQAVDQTNKDVLAAIQKNQPGQQTAAGSEFGTDATFAAAQQQGQALTRGLGGGQGGQPAAAPAAAPAALTPDQQKWLGGANPQDPYILSRMPGANQIPVSYFKDPKDQKIASGRGMPFAKESAESDGQLLTADPALARIVSLINYGK
jgi:hypothetical protein